MEYMYNMRDTRNMQHSCPMMNCPMSMQMTQMPYCMNYYNMQPNQFRGYQNTYGTVPVNIRNMNAYFYQVEMKPVALEEIID